MRFNIINNRPQIKFTSNGHTIYGLTVRPAPVFKFTVKGIVAATGTIPAGGEPVFEFVAGQNLSSGRAVIKQSGKVYYFNPNNILHVGRVIGITTTSATVDANVLVRVGGMSTDAAFNFTIDKPVYISSDGELTTSVPGTVIIQKAGVSIQINKILIDFTIPIIKH